MTETSSRERVALTLIAETAKGYRARHPELDRLTNAVLMDIEMSAASGLKDRADARDS